MKATYFFKILLALIPTFLIVCLLLKFYPNTGLGRIIALPLLFIFNSTLIIIGLNETRNLKFTANFMVWLAIILITIIITIYLYPQDHGPAVYKKIIGKISDYLYKK